ncbi:hypothetical protein [Methylobacterium oryzihabitans]|uniref:Uncharacterized protein n=1 Tax=Methylobacterium oryzihabitans TaxID=2499852 RepID=A0A3S2V4M3_9HYPH|nr:hypothetical protein [Methylobacterium oryzihabitans]RVU14121.1 hypothetical protein EOE48_24530 [Methylobacterium oryzihabitans]
MALEIDGLAVLCAIAESPEAFPAIRSEVTKAARALVVTQLKAKTLTVEGLRKVEAALGPQPLALILDGMKDAEVKSLVTRLDKHHPELKAATPLEHRRRLRELSGGTDPVGKPKPVAKAKAPAKAAPGKAAPTKPRAAKTEAAEAAPAGGRAAPVDALSSAAMSAKPPPRRRSGA